jgi:membrane fusion protein (multidrug efflux system)
MITKSPYIPGPGCWSPGGSDSEVLVAPLTAARSQNFYLLGAVGVVAATAVGTYFQFARNKDYLAGHEVRAAVAELGPRVEVVTTTAGPKERVIKLLGDVRAGASTQLYGKVSGYMKTMHVDKGDKVEAGQIVAEIESPELEQQYAAAAADLSNKQRNLARIRGLYEKGNATQVAMYQAETEAAVAENNVAVLATMKAYQTVRAPFAGRVTARFMDPGMLVTNAQTGFINAMPMITISDDTKVRVYAYLQQSDVPFVNVGDVAEVSDASNPDRKKTAAITRITGELEQRTRTMLIEVHLDNMDNFIVPGSFAYLTLNVPIRSYPQIPVTALLTRGNENIVAVLENNTLWFRPVKVASTNGGVVSLADGLKPGERVAINVPDEVTNGSRVQPIIPTK